MKLQHGGMVFFNALLTIVLLPNLCLEILQVCSGRSTLKDSFIPSYNV